jgi:hypothetical protein
VSYNQLKIIIIKFKNQRKIKNIKKKNPILANGVVESPHGQVGGGSATPKLTMGVSQPLLAKMGVVSHPHWPRFHFF